MPMTNYGGGFPQGLIVRGQPLSVAHPGRIFWVNNSAVPALNGVVGANTGNTDGSIRKPFSTIAYAIARCVANRGDIIFVAPGHAETISGAAGIDMNVAGVAVIGLGVGSLMPTLTLSATASTFRMSAANTTLMNTRWVPSTSDVVAGIVVIATNCTIINMVTPDAGATNEILTSIKATSTTNNNADGIWIEGCRAFATSTALLEFFEWNAHINGLVLKDNVIVNEGTQAGALAAGATGKNLLNAYIGYNKMSTKTPTAVNTLIDSDSTASTGVAENNNCGHADTSGAILNGLTGMGFRLFDNKSVSTASLSGFVLPAIDVDL